MVRQTPQPITISIDHLDGIMMAATLPDSHQEQPRVELGHRGMQHVLNGHHLSRPGICLEYEGHPFEKRF